MPSKRDLITLLRFRYLTEHWPLTRRLVALALCFTSGPLCHLTQLLIVLLTVKCPTLALILTNILAEYYTFAVSPLHLISLKKASLHHIFIPSKLP